MRNLQAFLTGSTIFLMLSWNIGQSQTFKLASFYGETEQERLMTPYLGGLNNPFAQTMDLNLDGFEELWVADRNGMVNMIYQRQNNQWVYDEDLSQGLPLIDNWHLLLDFDEDGIKDLFTFSSTSNPRGIIFYYGKIVDNRIHFERADFSQFTFDILSYESRPNKFTNIYVDPADLPAIADVDLDGDIDILSFGTGGLTIHFYRNMQVEENRAPGDYHFVLDDSCWGKVVEDGLSATIILGADTMTCGSALLDPRVEIRHAGSSLLLNQRNGDNRPDLLVGDVGTTTLINLFDSGNARQAFIEAFEIDFPIETQRVDIPIFPFPMLVDFDVDGVQDLLVAPGDIGNSDNINTLWYYRNTGTDDLSVYELKSKQTLGDQMFDFGSYSYPAILDINADGFKDIIVGTRGTYPEEITSDARLVLLQNMNGQGFKIMDPDYLGLSVYQSETSTFLPAAGDLDSDGDVDLLIGEASGRLIYLENTAGKNNAVEFESPVLPYQNLDVGIQSSPTIFDVNQDGLMDLVVGESNGNLNYFVNKGSSGNPSFEEIADNEFFGAIDTRRPGFFFGSSAPFLYAEEGALFLLTGSEVLGIQKYLIEDLSAAFTKTDSLFGNIWQGHSVNISMADLNNNGKLEAVIGNARGGISIYETGIDDMKTSTAIELLAQDVRIFPNPAQNTINIQIDLSDQMEYTLYNVSGHSIDESEFISNRTITVSHFREGVYFLQIRSQSKVYTHKVVIAHK